MRIKQAASKVVERKLSMIFEVLMHLSNKVMDTAEMEDMLTALEEISADPSGQLAGGGKGGDVAGKQGKEVC